ncbi:MAG: NAD(P)-dependent oxidoreductase [Phycisphaerales bacterium]|nr:NAD(P)-dependent oxidoreductase [Phycisphaerales bacterium]
MAKLFNVAWIGTGVMGGAMAGHLVAAGHRVCVHTRTKARAQRVLDHGAGWADSPAAAAEGTDVAFAMVGTPEEVEAVHRGPSGILSAKNPPRIVVDMSTSSPELAVLIDLEARARGGRGCDAPVTGGDIGARQATLSIMVGADEDSFAEILPLLSVMGKTVVRHGGPGQGQRAKLVNQVLIASTMVGMCEGLALASAAGLDAQRLLESVSTGAAGSWALANLAPRVLRGDLEPGFMVEHFVKDLGLALDLARRLNLDLPGLARAQTLYTQLIRDGHGRRGTQALTLAYAPRATEHRFV